MTFLSKSNKPQITTNVSTDKVRILRGDSNEEFDMTTTDLLASAGGGIPDIQTITSGIGDVTSSIINGETRTLYTYEAPNADLSTYTATLTGEIWEFTIPGTGDYLIFVGQGFDAATLNPLINKFYWHAEFTTGDVRFSYGTFQSSDGSITVNKLADTPNPGDITIKKIYQTYGAIENQIQSNTYVNGVADGSIETKLEMDAQTADVFTASQIRQDGGNWHYYVPYQYTEVDISSAEILAMGTTPVELLPAPGVGEYYDIDKIIFEYNHNTSAYTVISELLISGLGLNGFDSYIWIAQSILSQGANVVTVINPNVHEGSSGSALGGNFVGTDSVEFTSLNNPTDGDGTLKVKIWYRIMTFG